MIRRLRWKFVVVCMAAVFVVMALLVTLVNLTFHAHSSAQIDATLQYISDNGGNYPRRGAPPKRDSKFALDPFNASPEAPFMTRYFSVQFDADGEVVAANTESIAAVTEDEAVLLAQEALERGEASGASDVYRYLVSQSDEGALVTFVDASMTYRVGYQVLVISASVAFAICVAVFLMALLFSGKAVRPLAQSFEKQRSFITDAGHELKTPLTIISANCEILELNLGKNEWLTGIEKQTGRMRRLVNDLVSLSRMDEERPQRARTRFCISDAVYDTAMAFAPAAERAGRRLSVLTEPNVEITGDEAAVRQLTSILLDNAVKYADEAGEIVVTLNGGKHPVLAVENDCAGVDNLELSRLFDRFYRADPARTGDGSYGLGLSIARSIAQAHRASIRAEKARGSRLRVRVRF